MAYLLPFHPLNSPKSENFKKIKKALRDIIILPKCPQNHDDIKDDTVNFPQIRKMIWSRVKQPLQSVSVTRRPLSAGGSWGGTVSPPKWGPGAKSLEANAFLGLPEAKLHQILP